MEGTSTGTGSTSGSTAGSDILGGAKAWLRSLEVGAAEHHKNLTIFPLFHRPAARIASPPGGSRRYILLDDAIAAGEAVVEEVDDRGAVPLLAVTNTSSRPILIPEGQVLVGAKQNRTVNLTVLVAAGTRFELPVSCVEQSRWRYVSRHFRAAAYAHPDLREKKIRSAQRRRAAGGGSFSDQGEVWDAVDKHLQALAAPSPTRDMVDGQRAAAGRMKDYKEKIRLPQEACGFLAASGGRVVGLDLFDAPATLHKLWARLGEAYFAEALSTEGDEAVSDRLLADAFLASVVGKLAPAATQPELGFELELPGEELAGTALWHEGAICHLAAFAVGGSDSGAGATEAWG